eukprot:gene6001-biopygen201
MTAVGDAVTCRRYQRDIAPFFGVYHHPSGSLLAAFAYFGVSVASERRLVARKNAGAAMLPPLPWQRSRQPLRFRDGRLPGDRSGGVAVVGFVGVPKSIGAGCIVIGAVAGSAVGAAVRAVSAPAAEMLSDTLFVAAWALAVASVGNCAKGIPQ